MGPNSSVDDAHQREPPPLRSAGLNRVHGIITSSLVHSIGGEPIATWRSGEAMGVLAWLKGSTKPPSKTYAPQEVYARDIRLLFVTTATFIIDDFDKGLPKWLVLVERFEQAITYIKATYGDGIIDNNSCAIEILNAAHKGSNPIETIERLMSDYTERLIRFRNEPSAQVSVIASMINQNRWPDVLDGRIIYKNQFTEFFCEMRAYCYIIRCYCVPQSMREQIISPLYQMAEILAKEVGIKGHFLDVFKINAIDTIAAMERQARTHSDLWSKEPDHASEAMSGCFAVLAVICGVHLGHYNSDDFGMAVAQMAVGVFGNAKTMVEGPDGEP